MTLHELSLERRSLHGHFSRDLPPVLTVEPGDSVAFATLDSGWGLDAPVPPAPRSYFEPRDPDPVVVLEPKLIYRTERGEVPDGEHVVPLGKARVARVGSDVTLVAYGAMVPVCLAAADELAAEASCEVLDIRSLRPLDEDALLESASKTGRVVVVQEAPRTAGFGAEIAAVLAEKAILDLQGPVLRVTGFDVPYPYWKIEDRYMPSVERVVGAARKLLQF